MALYLLNRTAIGKCRLAHSGDEGVRRERD